MVTQERIATFIHSLDEGNAPYLEELEREARREGVPVIRPQVQSLLKLLLAIKRPAAILEVGTAIGFSALLMSEYGPKDCRITTIEKYGKRIPVARENFKRASAGERITLLEGDALELLGKLAGPYVLFLWMRPRASISTFCRMSCGCSHPAAFWCRITCCRMGRFWNPGMRSREETGRFIPGCGNICMRSSMTTGCRRIFFPLGTA